MLSPLYGQLSPLRIPTRSRFISNDADVVSYILTVEAVDGQQLEESVITAVENFIVGCKTDGIFSAIKACCLLAGARTLSGALVPLVGTAPTNFNFVTGDYNRKTGLKGNGSTKYLDSNRNNNADPQDNTHIGIYVSEIISSNRYYFGSSTASGGHSFIRLSSGSLTTMQYSVNSSTALTVNNANSSGFVGIKRSSPSQIDVRRSSSTTVYSQTSTTQTGIVQFLFRGGPTAAYGNPRLSFYSIGESLNLTLLDSRVSTLMNALAAAIP
jgi:hypothetical protein